MKNWIPFIPPPPACCEEAVAAVWNGMSGFVMNYSSKKNTRDEWNVGFCYELFQQKKHQRCKINKFLVLSRLIINIYLPILFLLPAPVQTSL